MSSRATAKRIGVHVGTLRKWADERCPPQEVAVKINASRWRWNPDVAVVLRWAADRRTESTDDPGTCPSQAEGVPEEEP